jgi:ADP-heptose:LPS heptosyltransferase
LSPQNRIAGTNTRYLLVNPTKYLGNLLIAGGLIQDFHAYCQQQGHGLTVVLDESFRELVTDALPGENMLFYPRQAIRQAAWMEGAMRYTNFIRQLRALDADIAFNIEEDAVSHRLTQFSKALHRLGCNEHRHRWGYEQVVHVSFNNRPAASQHRWYGYQTIFSTLGLSESTPGYMRLKPAPLDYAVKRRLENLGLEAGRKLIIVHAGATKDYKKWPETHFARLAALMINSGWQPAFIGTGADQPVIESVMANIHPDSSGPRPINLSNQLSLSALASFMHQYGAAMVGNDSGPAHLAAALGLPGVVIFGPTDASLWGPLSPLCRVMKGLEGCAAACSRRQCLVARRCLTSLSPEMILSQLTDQLSGGQGEDQATVTHSVASSQTAT